MDNDIIDIVELHAYGWDAWTTGSLATGNSGTDVNILAPNPANNAIVAPEDWGLLQRSPNHEIAGADDIPKWTVLPPNDVNVDIVYDLNQLLHFI